MTDEHPGVSGKESPLDVRVHTAAAGSALTLAGSRDRERGVPGPETQMVSKQGSSSVTARRLSALTSRGAKIKRT